MSDLPREWAQANLARVCDVILGQSPPGSTYNVVGEGMPFFQGKAEFGDIFPTTVKWTTAGTKQARVGDVLLSVRAPVGPTNMAPYDCVIGRGLAALRPGAHLDSKYLLWALRNSAGVLAQVATGSTFAAVTGDQVRHHRINLPPLAEQRRIVEAIEVLFSRLDAAESLLRRCITRLNHSLDLAFAGTFGYPSVDYVPLGEITAIVGGVTKDAQRESGPRLVSVPYLRVANVQRSFLDLTRVTDIRVHHTTAAKLALRCGDILFTEGGDRDKLGRGWVWQGQIPDCIHQNHVFRARLTSKSFDAYFISLYANTKGKAWFEAMGKQTTNLASINLRTLARFPVPQIPLEDQQRIVSDVERHRSLLENMLRDAVRAQQRSASLRAAILRRAFTGRLVPQNSQDEPVSLPTISVSGNPQGGNGAARRQTRTASQAVSSLE